MINISKAAKTGKIIKVIETVLTKITYHCYKALGSNDNKVT